MPISDKKHLKKRNPFRKSWMLSPLKLRTPPKGIETTSKLKTTLYTWSPYTCDLESKLIIGKICYTRFNWGANFSQIFVRFYVQKDLGSGVWGIKRMKKLNYGWFAFCYPIECHENVHDINSIQESQNIHDGVFICTVIKT